VALASYSGSDRCRPATLQEHRPFGTLDSQRSRKDGVVAAANQVEKLKMI
jgi:hypothetical protein